MDDEDLQALALQWVSGLSTDCQGSILSLSLTESTSDNGSGSGSGHTSSSCRRICYASGHTAVIMDTGLGTQQFLQGHTAAITCMAATPDRRHVITADSGPGSLLILWNSTTAEPVHSLSNAHPWGVKAMDVSPDGQLLATMGMPSPDTSSQDIALWDLSCLAGSGGQLLLLAATCVPAGDVQLGIAFSPDGTCELVSNGRRRVYFWEPHTAAPSAEAAANGGPQCGSFKYYSPPLRAKDFKQAVGDFTISAFIPGTSQAVTGTCDGNVVVWEQQGRAALPGTRPRDRAAIKIIRLHSAPITLLTTSGQFLVTGGMDGYVRFYDDLLRLVAWFEDLAAGPVAALSFSPPAFEGALLARDLGQFVAPDFVVATAEGKVVAVRADTFNASQPEVRRGALLRESMAAGVVDLAACPVRNELVVLGAAGSLQRWAFSEAGCQLSGSGQMPKGIQGSAMGLSRDGLLLAVGCAGGQLELLSALSLQALHSARNTPHAITRVAVAAAGDMVAVADAGQRVLLYGHMPNKHGQLQWELIGKCKAHHGEVAALMFGLSPAGATRLFSVGADRRLVEYDLAASGPGSGLVLAQLQDLMPEAYPDVPTAACFAPPLPYYAHSSNETLLLIADSGNKVRLHSPDTNTTLCVVAAPDCGGSITRLRVFRPQATGASLSSPPSVTFVGGQQQQQQQHPAAAAGAAAAEEEPSHAATSSLLAFSVVDRAAGVMAWPLDGHPDRSTALIAHPGPVAGLAVSADGRSLITAGTDGSVNAWAVRPEHLHQQEGGAAATAAHPADGGRWAAVLDDPALVTELRGYFDYAQVRIQGEEHPGKRNLSGCVPAAIVPDLMRAAGHYLSQGEAELVVSHLHFLAHSRPHLQLQNQQREIADSASGGGGGSDALAAGAAAEAVQHLSEAPNAAAAAAAGAAAAAAAGRDLVGFEEFLEVFVNHRPAAGRGQVTMQQLEEAFADLEAGYGSSDALPDALLLSGDPCRGGLPQQALLQLLQAQGEPLSEDELHVALAALTGAADPFQALPDVISAGQFCGSVLRLAAAGDAAAMKQRDAEATME